MFVAFVRGGKGLLEIFFLLFSSTESSRVDDDGDTLGWVETEVLYSRDEVKFLGLFWSRNLRREWRKWLALLWVY